MSIPTGCHRCSRRGAVAGGLSAMALGAAPRDGRAQAIDLVLAAQQGCCLVGVASSRYVSKVLLDRATNPVPETTGIPRFDRALGVALNELAALFEVRPGFVFFDGAASDNAFAKPEILLTGTNSGTVVIGRGLLRHALYRSADDDLAPLTICAHEFAHVVQFKARSAERLLPGEATKRRVELHADFLAGFYLGRRRFDYRPGQLRAVVQTFGQLGDTNFADVEHHGTAADRLGALDAGFRMGRARDFRISQAVDGGYYYLGV